jgi:hypothetical protein
MTELRPCTQCRRHVRVDARACPFCSVALSAGEPRTLPVGRLTRAAVFAGAMLASSCGSSQSKPDTGQGAHMPPPAPPDAAIADASPPPDATPPDAMPPDAAAKVKRPPRPDAAVPTKPIYPDHQIPKPYGAPPARNRLV